jgi:hypothetical protein
MSRLVEVPFVLSNFDGPAGRPVQSVTLYLTIDVSATSHPILPGILPINTTNAIATMEQATRPNVAQDSIKTTPSVVATAPESLSPPTDHVPIETSILTPPVQASMSAENALRDADEATKAINLTSTWEGAVARIKWVMDTVSPVAGVRRCAMSFFLMLD